MAIGYDDESGGIAFIPNNCEDCGEPLYDTSCDAAGCSGRACVDCGTGCDIEFAPEDGRCATSLAEEGDDEYDARLDRERAFFGLPPVAEMPSQQGGAS